MSTSETSIDETVEALLEIQRIDREIRAREEELEELAPQVSEAETRVEELRRELEEELEARRDRRRQHTDRLDDQVVEMYEEVRRGTTQDVLAPLNGDHCGHCFTMVPPQRCNEIRSGGSLYRCEGCGVILHAPGAGPDRED